ncbi:MAG: hypothetical protein K9I85_05940 [Saprospiraceae bacterium]|nr:hypothetical protein [Saprospiraceae bacterium]
MEYRKEHLLTLEEGRPIPFGAWMDLDGNTVSSDQWTEQISLILFAKSREEMKSQMDRLSRVLSQFDDREDVLFYQILPDSTYRSEDLPEDTAQWKILFPKNSGVDSMWIACESAFPVDPVSHVFLIDRRKQLRQAFSISDKASLTSLVEVVAILLPPRKLVHPELNRTKER